MNRKIVMVTITVILSACLLWHVTAKAKNPMAPSLSREEYREIEEIYRTGIREKLNLMGFEQAGITLTKVYREDGVTEYTGMIHHRRIDRMNQEEKEELKDELDRFAVRTDSCVFKHEFLSYE